MRIATLKKNGQEMAAVKTEKGYVSINRINGTQDIQFPTDLRILLQSNQFDILKKWYDKNGKDILEDLPTEQSHTFAPLYRYPNRIWGIGLNYVAHASDLSEKVPDVYPGSFIKSSTTVIGPGDTIEIPKLSERTTAEAELGVVFGKTCKDVSKENWLDVVAGFTTIIDMTAEDILKLNPRYLTLCKNFDTFFVFGPELVTPDEIDDVMALNVATVINGKDHASNVVSNMTFPPDDLVSFHSQVMTMQPGDVISTGTPGAVPIANGDEVTCRIDGFELLTNPVCDLKK
ncbi:MAG: fumarylacetoacetate hydrolase family protein [Candidatus Latescibacterota bacterium]|jgi:2-keto-4-pentenoate hydratase/2-oxohepta-3-ene-1,7-dioic acid hydratase in catechol pathway